MGFHCKELIKIIVLLFIIYDLGSVFADDLEEEKENQNNSQPKDSIPVGKPLISLSKIYSLNESKTQDEDGKGVNSTLVQKPENISSTLLNDLFSFIDEYPDYMQQHDFEDFAEEDEEPLDKNQNIQPPDAPPTISLRDDCQCGLPNINRIVGGSASNIKKYPWNVQILLKLKKFPFCGGTIINTLKAKDLSVRVGHTSGSDAGIIIDVLSSRMHEG
ncbi:Trypsin alpha [Armadillidium vulgare]|nr:Trypsin alpha [Armadillidium vulgare]